MHPIKTKRALTISLAIALINVYFHNIGYTQTTQTGLKGMVAVPFAEIFNTRSIGFNLQSNNAAYKFVTKSNRTPPYNNEHIFAANIGFFPRLNIMLSVVHDRENIQPVRQGIGDRSIQISYLVLKESKNRPAIVANITDPFISTRQYQNTNHIVVSKTLIFKNHKFKPSLGYGVPYYVKWSWNTQKREIIKNNAVFLTNWFGGIQYTHNENKYCSLEYDGQKINLGTGIIWFEKLATEFNLLGLKYPSLGISYSGTLK